LRQKTFFAHLKRQRFSIRLITLLLPEEVVAHLVLAAVVARVDFAPDHCQFLLEAVTR
jgi:hypothetical protein